MTTCSASRRARIAALTLAGDAAFPEARALYEGEPHLRIADLADLTSAVG